MDQNNDIENVKNKTNPDSVMEMNKNRTVSLFISAINLLYCLIMLFIVRLWHNKGKKISSHLNGQLNQYLNSLIL